MQKLKAALSSLSGKFSEGCENLFKRQNPGLLALAVILGMASVAVPVRQKDQPGLISFQASQITLPDFEKDAAPPALVITFLESAAKLDLIGKPFKNPDMLSPEIKGSWCWSNGSQLVFIPEEQWLPGTDYKGILPPSMFPKDARIAKLKYSVHTPDFAITEFSGEFYQHPVNPEEKRVIATMKFTHPVDTALLEKNIALKADNDVWAGAGRGFSVTYNKSFTAAYIHSDPVRVLPNERSVPFHVKNLKSSFGGNEASAGETSVTIPSIYSMFRVADVSARIIRNEQYEPETVLTMDFTSGATEQEVAKNISAWLLPKDKPAEPGEPERKNFRWTADRISDRMLAQLPRLELEPIATEKEYAPLHSFRFQAPPGRFIHVRINAGTSSYGGYTLAAAHSSTHRVPDFPRELAIMRDGTILSVTGDKKLPVVSRGIPGVKFELGRIIPSQINHLISQTGGNFKSPNFSNYGFDQDNISESFSITKTLDDSSPEKNQYSSLDMSEFMKTDPQGIRRGLFFLSVKEYDPVKKEEGRERDRRMILVTDLGLLVKEAKDGSRDVFVQSVRGGTPVSGATVEVLGKNGIPVATRQTDERGHAAFPSLASLTREKQPVAYTARKGDDLSFMPFNWSDRELSFSRFDVGGAEERASSDSLEAFLFSDRGIYRPGDEMRFGIMVKAGDWKRQLSGIPLEAALTDPRGAEIYARPVKAGPGGLMELSYTTEEISPTGSYTLSLYLMRDNKRTEMLGSVTVKAEEFLPDRMKITVRMNREQGEGWIKPEGLGGMVNVQNLFGSPAQGRRVAGRLIYAPHPPVFRQYPDYIFSDPKAGDRTFTEMLAEEHTDQDGNASFDFDLGKLERASCMLRFQADAFEAGSGRSVGGEASTLISTLDYLVGYKPDGDMAYVHKGSTRTVSIIAVNPSLKQITLAGLHARLYEQKFVSALIKQESGVYKYESVLREIQISTSALTLPEKGYTYKLPSGTAGDFRLSIRDAKETELSSIKFSVVGSGNIARSLEKNAELQLRLSKSDYAPGEEIEFQARAPYAGGGVATIERDRVYGFKWLKSDAPTSVQRIKVPENLEGNGYLCVSYVRDIGSREVFMSPLSYACEPFTVSRDRRTSQITLSAPETAKPGEPLKIKYKSSKPGRIIIYAVDEGILQVAAYKLPDPLGHFFRKRALGVRTLQILDLILPEFRIIQSLSAPGGDQDGRAIGKNLNPFRRKRDKPVAYWSGILPCDSTERETVYNLPDYFNGSLKIMAVEASDEALGTASAKTTVRGPLVLTPSMALAAAPGDELEFSVALANTLPGSGKNAKVEVKLELSSNLKPLDGDKRSLTVPENGEAVITFRLKAQDKPGNATATVLAAIAGQTVKASQTASIRPQTPHRVTSRSGALKTAGATVKIERSMYPDYRRLEATVSPLPLALANGLSAYLDNFPYGCTEQLVSKAFSALTLAKTPEFGGSREKAEAAAEVTLKALVARQNSSGAFGVWTDNSFTVPFHTAYAMHFLTEAEENGFPPPSGTFSRGMAKLAEMGKQNPGYIHGGRDAAYALYVQARNGVLVTNDLETLRQRLDKKYPNKEWRGDTTALFMAATYKLLRQDKAASALMEGQRIGSASSGDIFGDALSRDAYLLYLTAKHFPDRLDSLEPEDLTKMAALVAQERYNTFSSAVTILGLQAITKASEQYSAQNFGLTQWIGGKEQPIPLPARTFSKIEFSPQAERLMFKNDGDRPMFYQALMSGFDAQPPKQEVREGLEIHREYVDENGAAVSSVALGSKVKVRIRLRARDNATLENVAVVDLLPGGFEVVNERAAAPVKPKVEKPAEESYESEGGMEGEDDAEEQTEPSGFGSPSSGWHIDYTDIREDRVVLYGTIRDDAEFTYTIQAANRGTFNIPPAFAQSMYDRTIQALRPYSQAITVK